MAFDFSNATSSKFFNFLKNITGIGPVDGSDLIDPATEQLEEESFDDEYTVKMKGTDFNAETYMKPAEEQRLSERSTAAAESKAEKDKASEAEKQNEKLYIFSGDAGSYTRTADLRSTDDMFGDILDTSDDKKNDYTERYVSVGSVSSAISFNNGGSRRNERVASVGFDLNGKDFTASSGNMSGGASSGMGFTAKNSNVSDAGTVIQFFEPKETKQADDICSVLKAGSIVVVNLCNIKEETDKMRIIDFVAGCCKGIDAKAYTVSPKSIFIAAPRGVELRKPVHNTEQSQDLSSDGGASSGAAVFGGINFNVGGDRNTNSFIPRF